MASQNTEYVQFPSLPPYSAHSSGGRGHLAQKDPSHAPIESLDPEKTAVENSTSSPTSAILQRYANTQSPVHFPTGRTIYFNLEKISTRIESASAMAKDIRKSIQVFTKDCRNVEREVDDTLARRNRERVESRIKNLQQGIDLSLSQCHCNRESIERLEQIIHHLRARPQNRIAGPSPLTISALHIITNDPAQAATNSRVPSTEARAKHHTQSTTDHRASPLFHHLVATMPPTDSPVTACRAWLKAVIQAHAPHAPASFRQDAPCAYLTPYDLHITPAAQLSNLLLRDLSPRSLSESSAGDIAARIVGIRKAYNAKHNIVAIPVTYTCGLKMFYAILLTSKLFLMFVALLLAHSTFGIRWL
ncbi:hypothetical protein F5Y15DRAFT_419360 [Xylariaceae sp. FL0016]|nr:hypothetical protein F5Y15DRAFT_419360 [Xylariaceae sp. FL0016]